MDGLALRNGAGNLGGEVAGRDVNGWCCPRGAVANNAAAMGGSDHGQRRGCGMGAALGAAGHVDGDAAAQPGELRRQRGGEPARIDEAGRTGRRAGTGGDAAARIARRAR